MKQECTIPTTDTPKLPPIVCTPWCEDGDGHVTATYPDDQHCRAGYVEIELQREELELLGDTYYRRDVSLGLWREPFSEPHAEFFIAGQGGVKLTMDELEVLGVHALRLVAMARGEAR